MPPTLPQLSADSVTSAPEGYMPDPSGFEDFTPIPDADPISLRLDAIDAHLAQMSAGLLSMIEMLEAFAARAEPLLVEVEKKVARKGRLFGGGNV